MAAQEGAAGSPGMRVRYGADMDDSNFALHGRAVPLLVGLLCLVVVSVAVSLYLRWACRRRQRQRRSNDPEATSSSSAPAPTMPGLDADSINRLPVTLYSPPPSALKKKGGGGDTGEEEQAAAECSICIVELVAGDKVKALPPCGHCFHPDCVDAWLRSQPSCPLCRTLLVAAKPLAVDGSDDSPV